MYFIPEVCENQDILKKLYYIFIFHQTPTGEPYAYVSVPETPNPVLTELCSVGVM